MDSLTLAFALEGVRALGLGSRGAVDLLSVSLSTTDYVGHAYGPDSREIHDQVVRLDRSLGLFLQQLFVRYGSGGVLIVLTADHGVTPFPERSRAEGHRDAQRVNVDSMIAAVNARLDERTGGGGWVAGCIRRAWPAWISHRRSPGCSVFPPPSRSMGAC